MARQRKKSDIRERLGFAVKARREELQLTQEVLADEIQIHRTYLSDVERGSRNICLLNLERLAEALDLSLTEMFQRVDQVG